MSYTNSPPKYKTLKTKTTPPFCHEWQRASHLEVVISSSLEELASSSSTASSSAEAFGEGEGGAKLAMRACLWQYDRLGYSSDTSHLWDSQDNHQSKPPFAKAAPWASRVTPPTGEREGAKEDGTAKAVGLVVSTRGRFNWSWASLR